jgi:hypothetical protein
VRFPLPPGDSANIKGPPHWRQVGRSACPIIGDYERRRNNFVRPVPDSTYGGPSEFPRGAFGLAPKEWPPQRDCNGQVHREELLKA